MHIWCLATPPPRMMIPVLLAATAMLLILVTSEIQCSLRTAVTTTNKTRQELLEIYFTLSDVQSQAGVLI